jgi:hypothetical protein
VLTTLHARPRVHRAPGIPRALPLFMGGTFEQNSGASRGEIAELYVAVIARSDSDEAIHSVHPARWIASLRSQ